MKSFFLVAHGTTSGGQFCAEVAAATAHSVFSGA
jgi:hypothetical protein